MAPRPPFSFPPNRQGNAPSHPFYPNPLPSDEGEELNLRQIIAIGRRRKVLIAGVMIAVTSAVWIWTLGQTPQYEGKFQLLVEPVTSDEQNLQNLTKLTNSDTSPTSRLDYDTQIQVLRSPELMNPIVQQLRTHDPNLSYSSLISNLAVVRLQQTKILEIRYRGSNPQQIKFVLDTLSKGYLKYSLQERQTNLRQGIQFVEEQLETLQKRVDKLQQQLQLFRQRNNFIEPESQAQQLSTQLSNIIQQRLDTQKQLAETHALYESLQGSAGAASALAEAPRYQKLLEQLREIETKSAIESSRFRAQNPTMELLQDQRQKLLPVLREEAQRVLGDRFATISTQIQVMEVRAQSIAQSEEFVNQQLRDLPRLSRQYTDLQRELKVATESLNRFLATRETLQIETAQKDVPWQLLATPSQPQVPISPDATRNFIMGAIAGCILGILAALLAERLDNTFRSTDDLKDHTGLPLLGAIPFNQELSDSIEQMSPGFSLPSLPFNFGNHRHATAYTTAGFAEAFRSLHANIHLLSSDTPIRSLVISSALPSDGKSTVSLNLAQAAAAMGQRVLLVDADLRRPRISRLLQLPNLRGLSNLLASNTDPWQVIQRISDAHPEVSISGGNLSVLTAGQIPPDPTKLLASQKMHHLVERLQSIFDLVIYDSPPLIGLADSSLLARHLDGIVLVVGLGKTDRNALNEALDSLNVSHTQVLGMVANGVKHHTASTYSYYYHAYPHDQTPPVQNGNGHSNGNRNGNSNGNSNGNGVYPKVGGNH
ncbi:MAG: polysaccharide biosynthesis tyrosine autokinase [Scytolyngbya sp. HA4215-MV1]|jgi:capsular exopolysaccharide synthesis family protein|nr:polysaccharide biosynthesis tyrosine autokinase [Scytolyngbya sp. HA4215-MV1]